MFENSCMNSSNVHPLSIGKNETEFSALISDKRNDDKSSKGILYKSIDVC